MPKKSYAEALVDAPVELFDFSRHLRRALDEGGERELHCTLAARPHGKEMGS